MGTLDTGVLPFSARPATPVGRASRPGPVCRLVVDFPVWFSFRFKSALCGLLQNSRTYLNHGNLAGPGHCGAPASRAFQDLTVGVKLHEDEEQRRCACSYESVCHFSRST